MTRWLWYWFCQQISIMTLGVFFQFRVFGQRNVPRRGGVLFVSNHQSYLDPVLCMVGLLRQGTFVARRSLFRHRAFGWLIRSLNALPINEKGLDTAALRQAVRRLQEGWGLVIYPEGARTYDGRIGKLRGGMYTLCRRSGAPVTPMALDGAFEALPRTGRRLRFVRIQVAYGRTISPEEVAAMSREAFERRVHRELVRLLGTLRARRGAA
jgi:1-acyl-sn-glycerol-3-phosphate acyltransferase